jgi:hypothetical protein
MIEWQNRRITRCCILVVGILCAVWLLVACGTGPSHPAEPVSTAEAESLILASIRTSNPDLNPDASLSLQELTTDMIWDALSIQVFKSTSDLVPNQAYILTARGDVIPMGESFGGPGVTDMLVVDMDRDEEPELVFAYTWGSGISRTCLGAYAPAYDRTAILTTEMAYLGDMVLQRSSDHLVKIKVCTEKPGGTSCADILGSLLLTAGDGEGNLSVVLSPNLPQLILENIAYFE